MIASRGIRRLVMLASSCLAIPDVAHAGEHVTASADVTPSVGYSANPFLETGSDTGSGYAQIQVLPKIEVLSEKSDLSLFGSARYQKYFKHYDNTQDYNAGAEYKLAANSKLNIDLTAKYDNAVIGQYQDSALATDVVSSGTDISQFGNRERRQTTSFGFTTTWNVSSRDLVTNNAFYLLTRYGHVSTLSNYDGVGDTLGYSRQVAEHLQIGAQGSISRYTYPDNSLRDATVYSPDLSLVAQLNPTWKLDGTVGPSFIDLGTGRNSTTLNGNIELCKTATRSEFCATARRAVLPTGASGVRNELLAGFNYSYQLTEKDTLKANANYTRNSGNFDVNLPVYDYLRGSLDYSRTLTQKINLFFEARYSDILRDTVHRNADFGGSFGITAKLGRQ